MKISKMQLKEMIREAVRRQLNESDSHALYAELEELKNTMEFFGNFVAHIGRIGPEGMAKVFELKNASDSYEEFFHSVKAAKILMAPEHKRAVWDKFDSLEELMSKVDRYKELAGRFEKKEITDHVDRVYGRKRYAIVDKETGDKVKSYTNRKGSLGT